MPDPATRTPGRLKVLGVFLIIVMIVVLGATVHSGRNSRLVRSADGHLIKLERYEFQRGRELTLHLMSPDEVLAEFRIPNPCPGPHPTWRAFPLPLVATNGELEITLEKLTADGKRRRTECLFRIRENGRESAAWLPVAFEISDATGNHWRPGGKTPVLVPPGDAVVGWFSGALWPEEEAWKLRIEFQPANQEPSRETARSVEFLAKPEQTRDDLKPN